MSLPGTDVTVFKTTVKAGLNLATIEVTKFVQSKGWDDDRTFGDSMALLHSEVSEALEAYRDHGLADVTNLSAPNPKPEGVGSEFADIFIRLLDDCARYGINLADEFIRKMEYNHTREHRHGGKRL